MPKFAENRKQYTPQRGGSTGHVFLSQPTRVPWVFSKAMREILLAGDTNRLVAELTFVSRIFHLGVLEVHRGWIPAGGKPL